jgi:1-aminocyclopropane-1-carboxylate deaminase/D-cysteine desulfhydrase-like pyridoxal-dependent ACC family enzyme
VEAAVLRLDTIHLWFQGNKIQIKYYLLDALKQKKSGADLGWGFRSPHCDCICARENGLRSVGIVRGEDPKILSYTQGRRECGMQPIYQQI